MITKTAIHAGGMLMNGLFALPHATGYYSGQESLGQAIASVPAEIGAIKASDVLYDKLMRPDKHAKFFNDTFKATHPSTWAKGKILGNKWYKSLGHGVGRMALSIPMLSAASSIAGKVGNVLLPKRRIQQLPTAQPNAYNMQKTAEGIPRAIYFPMLDAAYGFGNSFWMKDKDKDILREAYNLPKDANLEFRNAGRSLAGGAIGAGLTALPFVAFNGTSKFAIPLAGFGSSIGAIMTADKYSANGLRDAKQILKKRRLHGENK